MPHHTQSAISSAVHAIQSLVLMLRSPTAIAILLSPHFRTPVLSQEMHHIKEVPILLLILITARSEYMIVCAETFSISYLVFFLLLI